MGNFTPSIRKKNNKAKNFKPSEIYIDRTRKMAKSKEKNDNSKIRQSFSGERRCLESKSIFNELKKL